MGIRYMNRYRASSKYKLTRLTKHDPRCYPLTKSVVPLESLDIHYITAW